MIKAFFSLSFFIIVCSSIYCIHSKQIVVNDLWCLKDFKTPLYPKDARKNNIEGYVKFEFTINSEGRVQDLIILKSEPEGVFDKTATISILSFIYEPTPSNHSRQPTRTNYTMIFKPKR